MDIEKKGDRYQFRMEGGGEVAGADAQPLDREFNVRFYRDGLGFDVLAEFQDYDGFDGVMLGSNGAAYHLEFTRKAGHSAGRAPTRDNLLVCYLPDRAEWEGAVARLECAGYTPVPSFNPYWHRHGKTFEDPNGYRIVLQNAYR